MMRAEGKAGSIAGARWAAMKELEKLDSGVDPDEVRFETLEEGGGGVTVVAILDGGERPEDVAEPKAEEVETEDPETEDPETEEPEEPQDGQAQEEEAGTDEEPADEGDDEDADEAAAEVFDDDDEDIEIEGEREPEREQKRPVGRRKRRSSPSNEWPDEPNERAREIVTRVLDAFDLDGDIGVEESEEELVVTVSGEDLGLFIGKHGQTIDAIQMVCSQACYRGGEGRKRVIVDAEGYRAQRAEALHRQADRAAADAVDYGRPVELDSMTASERRVVHNYLKEQPDVETHSEGDEPYRRIVVTPTAGELRYD